MDKRLHPDTFIRLYKSVVSNAAIQFGQPVIAGTRISASVIAGFVEAGDSVEFIAEMYSITEQQVRDAVWYYRKIKSPIVNKATFRKFTSNAD